MEYNKEIVKTATKIIQKFRAIKADDNGIIASQADRCFSGDRNAAADDIVNDFGECEEFIWDCLRDETTYFIQALLNAEISGYYVQDNGVYKTRDEYAQAQLNAVNEHYSKLNSTMQNLVNEVNTEIKKGTE